MNLFGFVREITLPIINLIDNLHTSQEEKLTLKNKLTEMQFEFQKQLLNYETKLMEAQSKVITSEIQSDSYLARNWRPLIMILFGIIIANNYILNPYLSAMFGINVMLPLPDNMWDLLKLGLTGFVLGRSGEKIVKALRNKNEK